MPPPSDRDDLPPPPLRRTATFRPLFPTGRNSSAPASAPGEQRPSLTATASRPCPHCGALQTTWLATGYRPVYLWRECRCQVVAGAQAQARVRELEAMQTQQQADALLRTCGLDRIGAFTLGRFVPQHLAGDEASHPYAHATAWLAGISERATADYHDADAPPCALYFYSPGKGRGKTHLAAALALEARRRGKLAAFVEENSFLDRLWSCDFSDREDVLRTPGERTWLTVIDDIGQRAKATPAVSDAWYGVLNRRWLQRGWTILTSNRTLDELLSQGTINDATYSRLMQMTRGAYVVFEGDDRRLVQP